MPNKKTGKTVPKSKATGKRVSWTWGGDKKYGKLIPSMEDKDARYARTENGKVKRLPKSK